MAIAWKTRCAGTTGLRGTDRIFLAAPYSYGRDRVSCLRTVRFTADSGFGQRRRDRT